jgi:hypothetical protein
MGLSSQPPRPPNLHRGGRRGPFCSPLGIKALIPGIPQLIWGQRERGLMFLISFLTSLGTTLFCWGDTLGWLLFGSAIATHMASILDVIRQRSFPAFPPMVATCSTLGTIGLCVYLPVGATLTVYAYPARTGGALDIGYLVNRLAYQAKEPASGHWIWLRLSPAASPRAGRVLAVAGQEVEWTGRRWQVDGKEITPLQLGPSTFYPGPWRFRVPDNHVLIGPSADAAHDEPATPLMIVGRNQIVGRAWARYYPFWDRCLL